MAPESNPRTRSSCFMFEILLEWVQSSAMSLPVITRCAPSPSGSLHLGNARTAFFSHLWARKSGGRFILRIEDTDVERSLARFRDELMVDLGWLGLDWDEGPDIAGPSAPSSQSAGSRLYQAYLPPPPTHSPAYPHSSPTPTAY